jgi:hypothetical protein
MANNEHVAILKEGVEVWNKWREENPEIRPDLSKAFIPGLKLALANFRNVDLSFANIRGVDLREADLVGADLSGADLSGANLRNSNMSQSSLKAANLFVANLSKANLSEAILSKADLYGTMLDGAILNDATFHETLIRSVHFENASILNARFGFTILSDVNINNNIIDLDTAKHDAPSTIGIDTIHRSKGKIAESFLRGAGVPENTITSMHLLAGETLQYCTCFISYSSKDQEFAKRLYADLQANGVRCWIAPHRLQGGKTIHEQIDQAIRVYDKLLLVLSEDSMNSKWVKTEIRKAYRREAEEKHRMLFPISLVPFDRIQEWEMFDADSGEDLAVNIREYFIPDFSNWRKDHDSHAKAFDRLLQDLKAEGK